MRIFRMCIIGIGIEGAPTTRRSAVAQQTGTFVASGLVEASHRPRWGAKRP
ncbi:hypothetical protein SAMN05660912_01049 [Pseudomonas sp. LAMO17WK12:I1]|jgi:hypothetical protein|nr:hypothetical protein FX984_02320 [Pseudomonas marginalis]SMF03019.1 hypothetical protein SAMN05660912_01049 [Pseudomonas sp. LAMO17WK12:I1]